MSLIETAGAFAGYISSDITMRLAGGNNPVANFSIRNTPRVKNQQTGQWENDQAQTLFIRCTAWGNLAQRVHSLCQKGDRIVVIGHWTGSSYQDKQTGQTRHSTEFVVDDLGPSMMFTNVRIERQQNYSQQAGGQQTYGQPGFGGQNYTPQPQQNPATPQAGGAPSPWNTPAPTPNPEPEF